MTDECECIDLFDPTDPPEMQICGMLVDPLCPIHGAGDPVLNDET